MATSIPQKRIGVALIGAGVIAKTHIAALSDMQDIAQLKAVLSRRPERAHELAVYYDGAPPEFTDNIAAVANDASIQMAIVATPPNVRKDVIEALEIVEICERAGVRPGILFQHRMRATSIAATRLIAGG